MIKSFSGQVEFCLLSSEPYLLTLAKTDYPSIVSFLSPLAGFFKGSLFKKYNNTITLYPPGCKMKAYK